MVNMVLRAMYTIYYANACCPFWRLNFRIGSEIIRNSAVKTWVPFLTKQIHTSDDDDDDGCRTYHELCNQFCAFCFSFIRVFMTLIVQRLHHVRFTCMPSTYILYCIYIRTIRITTKNRFGHGHCQWPYATTFFELCYARLHCHFVNYIENVI